MSGTRGPMNVKFFLEKSINCIIQTEGDIRAGDSYRAAYRCKNNEDIGERDQPRSGLS